MGLDALDTPVATGRDRRGQQGPLLSSGLLGLEGYGALLEYPEAKIVSLSEEHGTVDFSACARRPEVGERVTILPNHCCVVSNLFDSIVGVRRGVVEAVWPVAARGRLQ